MTTPTITDIVQVPQVTNWVGCLSDGTYRWVLPGTRTLLPGGPTADWMRRIDGAQSVRWGGTPTGAPVAPTETAAQLAALTAEWREAQQAADTARGLLADAARTAHRGGMSAYRLGQITGASEPTIRKWLRPVS